MRLKLPGWLAGRNAKGTPKAFQAAQEPPQTTESFCALGESLLERGRPREALGAFQQAIDSGEQPARAHARQARAYHLLGERQDAIDSLEIALALDERATQALRLLAQLHGEAGEWARAAELLQQASETAPQSTELRVELGRALNRSGRTQAAIATYRDAIERDPGAPAPKVNLGLIHLQQLGEPARAEAYFREALACAPDFLPAVANLGLALHDEGRFSEALEHYREALSRHPDWSELRWNRALTQLYLGELAAGWEGYESRFTRPDGRSLDRFAYCSWDGGRVAGRLLVLAEQGLGDEIMFASCLDDLQIHADGVVLECAPRLGALFARSFPRCAVHPVQRDAPLHWLAAYPDIAAKVAIGTIPRWLRRDRGSFPQRRGYLTADPSRVREYRGRLQALGPGMNVGVSWRAGIQAARAALRSIDLGTLLPVLRVPGVRCFCLQYGLDAAEREAVREAGIQVWEDCTSDIDGAAALIAALDFTVTVDNTNAHLTGGLGAPGLVLLPASPDWRWTRGDERSLWYRNLELLRADGASSWSGIMAALSVRLHALAASSATNGNARVA